MGVPASHAWPRASSGAALGKHVDRKVELGAIGLAVQDLGIGHRAEEEKMTAPEPFTSQVG